MLHFEFNRKLKCYVIVIHDNGQLVRKDVFDNYELKSQIDLCDLFSSGCFVTLSYDEQIIAEKKIVL